MIKRMLLTVLLIAGVFLFAWAERNPTWAGETEILINKLVEKGILTQDEAKALLKEMQNEAVRQKSTVKQVASDTAREVAQKEAKVAAAEVPNWVKKIKVKGDLRLRYQDQDSEGDLLPARSRERLRFRIGADTEVAEHWKVGFGLATGGPDPRSTNQSFSQTFQTPDIRLDYAYAQYQPWQFLKFIGGRQKNQLWRPKDLLWDSDIRPEGTTAPFTYKLNGVELFGLPAFYRLAEFKSSKEDSYMWLVNAGANFKFAETMNLKFAATYYDFANMVGNSFIWSSGSNSTDADGNLIYDYDSFAAEGEFGIKFPGPVPYAAAFGQYIYALDPDRDNKGWLAGVKFGHKKVKKFAQWLVKYNYRHLERDAWPDFLPDSDFADGRTNAKGHEFEIKFGLAKNITLGLDYYFDVKPIKDQEFGKQKVLQVDLLLKW
ncbi:MAG: putative porin [Deltaproteobacteria bacterium]|nr:putative porin [Deltaproteobacteria bacterium]